MGRQGQVGEGKRREEKRYRCESEYLDRRRTPWSILS